MQAYVQLTSNFNQDFYIWLPPKLILLLGASSDYIIKVIKPLYGIPEVGNHQFVTYHTHHKKKLGTIESTYDSYLLYRSGTLEIVRMQTNNILILTDNNFANKEKEAIKDAKIMTKDCEYLTSA